MPERAKIWQQVFAAEGEPICIDSDAVADPEKVTVLACWQPPADLSIYPNLRAVLSVGAGVDQMPRLPQHLMLCRSLAPGIETQVRDWVVMACLMAHRNIPTYLEQASAGDWQAHPIVPNHARRVGILGMGRIGRLVAGELTRLGFPVSGWSRSGRPVDGVTMFSQDQLGGLLEQSDILVCLLPLTDETRGLLNQTTFDQLPKGAHLVHAGRGAQLVMGDLREALDTGRLASAILDVTTPEPLPKEHWAWSDPRVLITPHIAAQTDAVEGARHALEVLRAIRKDLPPPGMIDQAVGY
ncbi:glyoxylate/hydroxypyruvate reductase A [Tropicibacter sp. R15_0]|nr:glyoxylate/hydroxypyruvate reductase A [Tropicibacter sp. R15_0]MBO9467810.1 glyoxylate/hydroxypyruvate reductase A [Tropicibacter sp. R15_0]